MEKEDNNLDKGEWENKMRKVIVILRRKVQGGGEEEKDEK